jgi:hypothetical protein
VIIPVYWSESPNHEVQYQRDNPGLVLAADDRVWGVRAPRECGSNLTFSMPMLNIPDPRFDPNSINGIQVLVQMLVAYAWYQGLLSQVRFFGALNNYRQNIMVGVGYSTVRVTPCFDPISTDLASCLRPEFDISMENVIGSEYRPPLKKNRHQRPWVI